jgi:hypothetical protein
LDLRDKDDPLTLKAGAVAVVASAGRFAEQPDILGPTVPRFDRQVALERFRAERFRAERFRAERFRAERFRGRGGHRGQKGPGMRRWAVAS